MMTHLSGCQVFANDVSTRDVHHIEATEEKHFIKNVQLLLIVKRNNFQYPGMIEKQETLKDQCHCEHQRYKEFQSLVRIKWYERGGGANLISTKT